MIKQPEPLYPHGTPADEIAWLERQDKATLVEIICQLRCTMFVGPKLLDEAILRAHQNRLLAAMHAAYEKCSAFDPSATVDLPTPQWKAAWGRRDRDHRAWMRATDVMNASWDLKPGFHRGNGDKP